MSSGSSSNKSEGNPNDLYSSEEKDKSANEHKDAHIWSLRTSAIDFHLSEAEKNKWTKDQINYWNSPSDDEALDSWKHCQQRTPCLLLRTNTALVCQRMIMFPLRTIAKQLF
ncbi:hypothetical protein DFH28DRAFT_923268 [Melampsora americana]|nr:hypothetical protein DFH28DRAFT_923268 [Melampsora americana]